MKKLFRHFLISTPIIGACFACLCLLEAIGFFLTGVDHRWSDFLVAVLFGQALAVVVSLALALALWISRAESEAAHRIAPAVTAGSLAYLLVLLGLKPFVFGPGEGVTVLAGLMLLAVLAWILGRVVLKILGGNNGAFARHYALVPAATIAAAVISTASRATENGNVRSVAVVAAIVAVPVLAALIAKAAEGRDLERHAAAVRVSVISVVLVLALGAWMLEKRSESRPATIASNAPNVILITVDTLRADVAFSDEGRGGGGLGLPPALRTGQLPPFQQFAADGIKFANAMAASCWTPTSVASIVTGLYPAACGAGTLIPGEPYDYTGPLDSAYTMAEAFRDSGYATAAFVDSAWLYPARGYAQGFDRYEMLEDFNLRPKFLFSRLWEVMEALDRPVTALPAERLTDKVVDWLPHRPKGPFFLWVHYFDPHMPYYPQPRYPATAEHNPMMEQLVVQSMPSDIRAGFFGITPEDKKFIRERYAGEVRYTEDQFGRLIGEIKRQGLYNGSIIAFGADHGDEFWEHGGFEHGQSFHTELVHVPLVVKLPGNTPAGVVLPQRVSTTRIGKTLLEAAGVKSEYPGTSLLACLSDPACGAASLTDTFWFSQIPLYDTEIGAVGDLSGFKALFHGDGSLTCYDTESDPGETLPIPEAECPWPEAAPGPREMLKLFEKSGKDSFISLGGEQQRRERVPAAALNHLKALGYIQ